MGNKIKKQCGLTPLVLFLLIGLGHAETNLTNRSLAIFATVQKGKAILGQRDDFIKRLSPFDRESRVKTEKAISEDAFLQFLMSNVIPWSKDEEEKITSAIQALKLKLTDFALEFPDTIYLIKTTGNEEGNAIYTRSNAIIIPEGKLGLSELELERLMTHELFHILSRHNPKLREQLYGLIGFQKCNEIEFPPSLNPRKITNPDAPINDYYIHLQVKSQSVMAIPILFSEKMYDVRAGGDFFDYLTFRMMVIQRIGQGEIMKPRYNEQNPILLDVNEVSGFFERIGRNTEYIIHPDEILADNFVLLVFGQQNVQSPELLDKMRKVLLRK